MPLSACNIPSGILSPIEWMYAKSSALQRAAELGRTQPHPVHSGGVHGAANRRPPTQSNDGTLSDKRLCCAFRSACEAEASVALWEASFCDLMRSQRIQRAKYGNRSRGCCCSKARRAKQAANEHATTGTVKQRHPRRVPARQVRRQVKVRRQTVRSTAIRCPACCAADHLVRQDQDLSTSTNSTAPDADNRPI